MGVPYRPTPIAYLYNDKTILCIFSKYKIVANLLMFSFQVYFCLREFALNFKVQFTKCNVFVWLLCFESWFIGFIVMFKED